MFKLFWRAFLVVVVITAVGLAFLLGLSFGLSNNHDKFVTETVPVLSMLGGWVSGIGALLAVITSLAIVKRNEDQQRDREKERIVVEQWASGEICSIRLISMGLFACTVKGVFLRDPGGHAVPLHKVTPSGAPIKMPARIESRQDLHFGWTVPTSSSLVAAIASLKAKSIETLQIEIRSVTGTSSLPISADVVS